MTPSNFFHNRLPLAGVCRAHFRGKSRRKGVREGTLMMYVKHHDAWITVVRCWINFEGGATRLPVGLREVE